MESRFEDVTDLIQLDSEYTEGSCRFCSEFTPFGDHERAANHYMQEHDYKLLHIGTVAKFKEVDQQIHDYVVISLGR